MSSEMVSVVVMGSGHDVAGVAVEGVSVGEALTTGPGDTGVEVGVSMAGAGIAEGETGGMNVAEGIGVGDGERVSVGEVVGDGVTVKVAKGVAQGVGDGPMAATVPLRLVSVTEVKVKEMNRPSKIKIPTTTTGQIHLERDWVVSGGTGMAVVWSPKRARA